MKRLIRFMSEEELEKYLGDKPLENNTVFEQSGSKGFCFFDADDIDPFTAQHILAGIATMDYMVEFMVEERTVERMTKGKGTYHKPHQPMFDTCKITEYSTTSYNKKDFFPWQIWRLYIKTPVYDVKEVGGDIQVKVKNRKAF